MTELVGQGIGQCIIANNCVIDIPFLRSGGTVRRDAVSESASIEASDKKYTHPTGEAMVCGSAVEHYLLLTADVPATRSFGAVHICVTAEPALSSGLGFLWRRRPGDKSYATTAEDAIGSCQLCAGRLCRSVQLYQVDRDCSYTI